MPGPALFIRLLFWLGVIEDDVARQLTRYTE